MTDITPPSIPQNVRIGEVTTTSVVLAWDASVDAVGVTGYDIYVDNVFLATVVSVTVIVSGLNPGTQYYFSVRARDAAGNVSGVSASVSTFTAGLITDPPVNVASTLEIQRRMTHKFILMDPTLIFLIPTIKVKQPSGSTTEADGTPRTVQKFKLIPQQLSGRVQQPTITVDGVERIISYILLGEWNAVMAPGDHWVDAAGRRCTVIILDDGHGYETKGLVEAHG